MRALAPFGGFPRKAVDILPVWRHPMRLDNARLVELLGAEPRMPVVEAVRATLAGLRRRPETSPSRPSGASLTALKDSAPSQP